MMAALVLGERDYLHYTRCFSYSVPSFKIIFTTKQQNCLILVSLMFNTYITLQELLTGENNVLTDT